ncbi:unnamed protein product [Triticum turgidum subsp. durum]|uniref:Methyltransferase type 11 domain-containing protein n=1 Tax=Triticum turgidum subsp. durum TaxID=4567 RepID=A0A9R1NV21_TRITD|nr:unnamed protein product [Triticum turgidum subsp. durum]
MATTPALHDALLDFTSRENWDKFFALRGDGDSFEWYAEWPQIKAPLLSLLLGEEGTEILVPGCGSSSLSEQLYDLGFRRITNVDFSRVIVADMLRRHARVRPQMRWRVMDMTNMQFPDGSFDFILDKGGLDALMEPEVGTKLGMKYLDEAKRVLKLGGKFACFTLAESHVLDLLLSEFRFGWDMTIQAIASEPSSKSAFQTFMVVMVKGKMGVVHTIKSLVDQSAEYCNMQQANAVIHALQNENKIRESHNSGVDILFSLRDLQLGAIGDLKVIVPGRRRQLILGEQGSSLYCYKAVLMDAKNQTETFAYHCGVFIVPKARAQEWLFASEEGQWLVVESAKAARLIMVFLDSRHASADIDVIKKDLSPLVMDLEPEYPEETDPMPFMMASDGVKQRDVLQEVTSEITGPMVVEDVLYENVDGDQSCMSEKMFRRLIFKRSSGLVQSEALLMRESPSDEMDSKTKNSSTSSKKKSQKKGLTGSKDSLRVDHSYLGSSYHSSIICGLSLVASALSAAASSGERVVELDPVMEEVATKYFGFSMDEQLKVHLGDGIKFIEENAHSERNGKDSDAVRILIVDVDSSDLSSGLSCPPANFVEDAFLMSAKKFLSAGGLLIINLVARSSAVREMAVSRLKAVFENLYSLQLEEDVNEVLFASPSKRYLEIDHLDEAATKLKAMLKFPVDVESDMKNLQRLQ